MAVSDPTVSVVLPTYNRADIIDDPICSVLTQTYEDFELIVVDDGSTDNTAEVIEAFDDDRIRYIKHDGNKGAPAARNTGIEASQGEYIAFQDSDDDWLPDKLEKQMQTFRDSSSSVGVVYTGMKRKRDDKTVYIPYEGVEQTEGDISKSILFQNFVPAQVAMVRKRCFDEVGGFDEQAWPISDWELWIRISKQYQFKLVDEPLVTGEIRSDSISRSQRTKVEARERIIGKHHDNFHKSALASQLFYIGHGFMKLGQEKKGRKYLNQAVKTSPHPIYIAALILSLFPRSIYIQIYEKYKTIV